MDSESRKNRISTLDMQYKLVFVQIPPLYRPIKALQSDFGHVWVTAFKESTQQGMQAQHQNLREANNLKELKV